MGLLRYYRGPGIDQTPTGAPGPAIAVRNSWSDRKTPFPKAHIGDTGSKRAFRKEVQHAIAVNGWQTGAGNVFIVYTGPGYQSGLTAGLCGEHSAYQDPVSKDVVPYAYIPRPGLASACISGKYLHPYNPTPSGSVRIDGAISTAWHELAEMLTDPEPNSGYSDAHQGEIGDICRESWPNVTGKNHHNVVLHGHEYLVQAIWVRAAGGCVTTEGPNLSQSWHSFQFGLAPATAVTFTVHDGSHNGTLEVTDAYCQGDRFEIWDNGHKLGPTSYIINVGCPKPSLKNPQKAFTNGGWSAGTYTLPKGPQHISIQVIQNALQSTGGAAFYATSQPSSPGTVLQRPGHHIRHATNG